MRADIELLKADIKSEMGKLEKLCQEFMPMAEKLALSEDDVSKHDIIVLGYLMHNFYNGCENMFRSIARFFENEMDADSWHKDLLRRMTFEIEGFRPRVISDQLYLLLDDFRGFRHKFRYAYSFELDWEREKVVARKFKKTWALLQNEIGVFMGKLEKIPEEPQND